MSGILVQGQFSHKMAVPLCRIADRHTALHCVYSENSRKLLVRSSKAILFFAVESDWLLAHLVTGVSTLWRLCGRSRALPSSDVSISLLFKASPILGKRATAVSASREKTAFACTAFIPVSERVRGCMQ